MKILFINGEQKPQQLPNFIQWKRNSITIFSNNKETFGVRILSGDANFYSIDSSFIEPKITIDKTFNNDINSAYTIYPLSDELLICLSDLEGNLINYQIHFDTYKQPSHYEDVLVNKHLPEYDELKECILFTDEYDKTNLVARMLLDVSDLMRYRGTLIGIKKFLNFVGFIDDTFSVNREYKTPEGNITFSPNKQTDIATGNYSIWINNYLISNTNKYTRKNLPNFINLINDQSIDEFVDKLRRSFAIAMKYFTLDEQDISYIGFSNMSNGMRFQSIAGNMTMCTDINPQLLAKSVSINMYNYYTSDNKTILVNENIQEVIDIYKSEVKFITNQPTNREIFIIEREVFDDVIEDMDFNYKRLFGTINHIHIDSINTYVEVEISGIDNRFVYLKIPKQFIGDSGLIVRYLTTQSGRFNVKITIWDRHNNREVYEYLVNVDTSKINARFDVFTSHELVDKNEIDLDITSSSNVSEITDNIVLKYEDIPDDLKLYYDNVTDDKIDSYLTNNHVYKLPPINSNIGIDKLTDLPIDYVDNFLNIITFPIDLNVYKEVVIRPKSINKTLNENGSYFPLLDVYNDPDNYEYNNLFITTLVILDSHDSTNTDDSSSTYLFISTTESGIDLNAKMYDIGLLDVSGNVTSIYEMNEFRSKNLPINYDFYLFHNETTLNHPNAIYYPDITDTYVAKIESIYPKLLNIKQQSNVKSKVLKYGDIIVASIDTDTITGHINMNWKLYNSFTGELVYNTNDYALKYRINENVLYTIVLELEIDSITTIESYYIDAVNVVSSFG